MVGFSLTKEQLLQQQLYREFAEKEVKPKAADMDEAEKYDVSIMDKMAKYGMLGIPFPKEDGGSGASVLSYALCVEELAKVDASTATACSVHTSLCTMCKEYRRSHNRQIETGETFIIPRDNQVSIHLQSGKILHSVLKVF